MGKKTTTIFPIPKKVNGEKSASFIFLQIFFFPQISLMAGLIEVSCVFIFALPSIYCDMLLSSTYRKKI